MALSHGPQEFRHDLASIYRADLSTVAAWRQGRPDAYGRTAERFAASTGQGTPCRHCVAQVPLGRPYLLVAHRPFAALHPYAETGPVVVCAEDCPRGGGDVPPAAMLTAPAYLLRAYGRDERIIYGSGGVVPTCEVAARAAALLDDPAAGFVHVRSASNNCFFFRVQRG